MQNCEGQDKVILVCWKIEIPIACCDITLNQDGLVILGEISTSDFQEFGIRISGPCTSPGIPGQRALCLTGSYHNLCPKYCFDRKSFQ